MLRHSFAISHPPISKTISRFWPIRREILMPVLRGCTARFYLNWPRDVAGGVWLSSSYSSRTKDASCPLHLPQSEDLRRRGRQLRRSGALLRRRWRTRRSEGLRSHPFQGRIFLAPRALSGTFFGRRRRARRRLSRRCLLPGRRLSRDVGGAPLVMVAVPAQLPAGSLPDGLAQTVLGSWP